MLHFEVFFRLNPSSFPNPFDSDFRFVNILSNQISFSLWILIKPQLFLKVLREWSFCPSKNASRSKVLGNSPDVPAASCYSDKKSFSSGTAVSYHSHIEVNCRLVPLDCTSNPPLCGSNHRTHSHLYLSRSLCHRFFSFTFLMKTSSIPTGFLVTVWASINKFQDLSCLA